VALFRCPRMLKASRWASCYSSCAAHTYPDAPFYRVLGKCVRSWREAGWSLSRDDSKDRRDTEWKHCATIAHWREP
jgi:hypothetical protein